jgi:predicted TIM-barrel fold metal-dependent hydrolase
VRWEDDDPGLPIKFGPCANDEYEPVPLSPVVREAIRRARQECDDQARRTGVSRRRFLLSACAAATTLLALDACTSEAAKHRGLAQPGGRYRIPKEATTEPSVANGALGGHEFIFDVQNHLLDYSLDPHSRDEAFFGADFPQALCGDADPHDCFSVDHFLEEIFLKSDTSMAIVSSLPIRPEHSAESIQVRDKARRVAHAVCHDDRVLIQGEAHPTLYPLPDALAAMEQMAHTYPLAAWKVYTHQPGPPWWLDDHEAGLAPVGAAFIRKAVELGIPRICVHKGLVGGPYASPVDIGPAARTHPDVAFLVYHSGYDIGGNEGPYTEATANMGVNRLITSMQRAGIGPNQNVYAELGTTWYRLLQAPDQAAHVLGKLLRYVGADNVLWGTDSIWYGSPQDQIQALRTFEISTEFQDRYGYPALTEALKAKIFGQNALRAYGVHPITGKCTFTRQDLAQARLTSAVSHRTYGPSTPAAARTPRTARPPT